MNGCIINVCVFVFGILNTIQCYSTGAPWFSCLTMFPVHNGAQRQTDVCPFQVMTNVSQYSLGDSVKVSLNSTLSGRKFKGYQIRARPKYGDTDRIVGRFVDWSSNVTRTMDCLGGLRNVVTNKDNQPLEELQLTWMAPSVSYGDIEFVISFVESFETFWTEVTVPIPEATFLGDEPNPTYISQNFEGIDWNACGISKGCYLYPRFCTGDNCYAAVTYKILNNTVQFEMFGPQSGYISVGFSKDKSLGEDETITCTADNNNLTLQHGYNNEEMYNDRQYKDGITDIQAVFTDNRLFCRFTRPLSMNVYVGEEHRLQKKYDLNKEHYIILAWGDLFDGTDVIRRYKELPPITDASVDLHKSDIVRGSSLPLTTQIHGTLMLLAWMLLISISLLIARHFKGIFKEGSCWGNTIWLQIHRGLAITAWLFTVAGFILIFVAVGKMSENAKVHSYLGITVMAASTLQVIAGVFRPNENSSMRFIYNMGHWFVGKCTQIIAGIAFFFAFSIDIIPQPQKRFAYIVLGVYSGIVVLMDVFFDVHRKVRQWRASVKYELKNMTRTKISQNVIGSYPALMVYILCVTCSTAAALSCIYLF